MVKIYDWSFRELLEDQLHLLTCADGTFLSFLANCLHPYVVRKKEDIEPTLDEINQLLEADGYELSPTKYISKRPVHAGRKKR